MKLIIHCGFHKTGTSSFQHICYNNLNLLQRNNIFYPEHVSKQHWYFFPSISPEFLQYQYDLTKNHIDKNGTWLLSAEDFEGFLVRIDLAKQIELFCENNNIELEWIFVNRNQFEYLNSLYGMLSSSVPRNEISKSGFVLNYDVMADTILKNGILSMSNFKLDYHFIFDYINYIENFSKNMNSKVSVIDYQYFNEIYSGRPIMKYISKEVDEVFVNQEEIKNMYINTRLSDYDIEKKYLSNYLWKYDDLDESLDLLINYRVDMVRRMKIHYESIFKERFSEQIFNKKESIV